MRFSKWSLSKDSLAKKFGCLPGTVILRQPKLHAMARRHSMPASEGPEGRQNQQAVGGYEAAS
jgi:hypothetical protein